MIPKAVFSIDKREKNHYFNSKGGAYALATLAFQILQTKKDLPVHRGPRAAKREQRLSYLLPGVVWLYRGRRYNHAGWEKRRKRAEDLAQILAQKGNPVSGRHETRSKQIRGRQLRLALHRGSLTVTACNPPQHAWGGLHKNSAIKNTLVSWGVFYIFFTLN